MSGAEGFGVEMEASLGGESGDGGTEILVGDLVDRIERHAFESDQVISSESRIVSVCTAETSENVIAVAVLAILTDDDDGTPLRHIVV